VRSRSPRGRWTVSKVALLVNSPTALGRLRLKNRWVMAPMVTSFPEVADRPTRAHIKFYERRARGGVGFVVVGATYVAPEGRGFPNQMGIDQDDKVATFRGLATQVQQHAPAVLQLFHAGPKTSRAVSGHPVVGPASWPQLKARYDRPCELSDCDLERIAEDFTSAAERAAEAGFVGVELHGANGYLLHAVIDASWDSQSVDRHTMLPLRIVRRIRERLGSRLLLGFTISPDPALSNGGPHDRQSNLPRFVELAQFLDEAGIDYLHVYRRKSDDSRGQAKLVYSSVLRDAGIKLPTIEGAGVKSQQDASHFLNHGASLVAVGRVLLIKPDFTRCPDDPVCSTEELRRLSTSLGIRQFFAQELAQQNRDISPLCTK
jgi:2,4-dienoyl-CoA reductase-like NADH-dependent reductase (Old Yellow Enzyme family)